MPENINKTDHCQWWVAYNDKEDFVVFGEAEIGVRTVTGQPHLEVFDEEEPWAERVRELGREPYPPEEETDGMGYYENDNFDYDGEMIDE